ncbi:MAG: hypothetical protein M0R35_06595 [Candidatus Omnitrophica bacterium]|jgi:hypothetical protein|nr:hypothetical protein [Candidatus Omnitrophota bacterium]
MKRRLILFIFLTAVITRHQTAGYCETSPSALESVPKYSVVTSETIDLRKTGLRAYNPKKCYKGYALFNNFPTEEAYKKDPNGWRGFTAIYLLDTNGEIAYRWMAPGPVGFSRIDNNGHLFYLTHPLAIKDGLHELDPDNNEVWNYDLRGCGRDLRILENGLLMVLNSARVNSPPASAPKATAGPFIVAPHIAMISRDKKVLWSWQGEKYIPEFEKLYGKKILLFNPRHQDAEDWFHANTCEILKDSPLARKDLRFRKGNILFCSFYLDLMGIIEYPSGKIVWSFGPGILDGPHSPAMLDNGNFLILDNGVNRGWSRVIEIDPLKKEIVWEYHADPPDSFYSPFMSNATRLPNGNTFICDGVKNRLFEVTPSGEIAWDMIPMLDGITGYFGILRAEKYSGEYLKPLLDNRQ